MSMERSVAARDAKPPAPRNALPLPEIVALVLQGGGALGSFQAGVAEALHDAGIPLGWVAGISIGAVNAALIAGNPPEQRLDALERFWRVATGGLPDVAVPDLDRFREAAHLFAAGTVASFGVPGFFRPHLVPPLFAAPGSPEATSVYDTSPLVETLDGLVDWDLLNDGPVRVSVGAVNVETGNFRYFDNRGVQGQPPDRIDARHILASGALPPGFPAIEIDGCWWWDGGLVSNTPLGHILDNQPDSDMLVFQVDLFPAAGPLPRELSDVWSREKDIRYSSRTRQVTDQYLRVRREHARIRSLLAKLPPELRDDEDAKALEAAAAERAVNIVHLIYRLRAWETGARDFEFSGASARDHWRQGRSAVNKSIRHGEVLARNIVDGRTAAFDPGD